MSTPPPTTAMPGVRTRRRARVGVALLFALNGVIFANVVPRYPELKDHLGLSNTTLGTAIAAFPLGALLSGLLAGRLVARWGSARVATGGLLLMSANLVLVAFSTSWLTFTGARRLPGSGWGPGVTHGRRGITGGPRAARAGRSR